MDGAGLYETDILEWSERQAAALRALSARRDLPNALDLENVIEEVESVGRTQLRAAESAIRLILTHAIKAACDPAAPARAHWRTEAAHWHAELQGELTPSMPRRIALDRIWQRALRAAEAALAEHGVALDPALPEACPAPLELLIAERLDFDALVAALRG